MSVCLNVHHVCPVHTEARRRHQNSRNSTYRWLWGTVWVTGAEGGPLPQQGWCWVVGLVVSHLHLSFLSSASHAHMSPQAVAGTFWAWDWICWLCCNLSGVVRITQGNIDIVQAYAAKARASLNAYVCQADGSVKRRGWEQGRRSLWSHGLDFWGGEKKGW